MLGGNQVYDTFTSSRNPIYLGVVEAIPLIRNSLGSLDYEEELTVCFVKEARAADESGLSYQLSRRLGIANAAFTTTQMVVLLCWIAIYTSQIVPCSRNVNAMISRIS